MTEQTKTGWDQVDHVSTVDEKVAGMIMPLDPDAGLTPEEKNAKVAMKPWSCETEY